MPDAVSNAKQEAQSAVSEVKALAEKSFADLSAAAERTIQDVAKRAEKVFGEGFDSLRERSRGYTDNAGERFDEAQRYVVERVKEKPVTATVAGIGVGFLIGLLLASRSK